MHQESAVNFVQSNKTILLTNNNSNILVAFVQLVRHLEQNLQPPQINLLLQQVLEEVKAQMLGEEQLEVQLHNPKVLLEQAE